MATCSFTLGAIAQNFNYKYVDPNGNSNGGALGKSITQLSDDCGVAMANSLMLSNLTTDFQVTFVTPTGNLMGSYAFGDANENEICNGICNSIDYDNQFLLCGQGKNDQMLVMKVDINGNLIWSKEITFSAENSEAITIFQVNNNYNDRGYIVVGNSNSTNGTNSVAAAKLDENGNMIWAAEYNMGVKLLMTDAIARNQHADRIFSVVGFQQYGGIFYLNIYAGTGNIFYYPGATYALNSPIPLFNPQLTEITEGDNKSTAISFMRDAFGANSVGMYLFEMNGYDDFAPFWAKHYEQNGVHGYINADLITTSTEQIALAGSVNTDITFGAPFLIQTVHPYILNTDFNGNLLSTRDYNYDNDPYELATSVMESCTSGEVAFNGSNLNPGVQWDLKLIKQDSPGWTECSEQFDWWEMDEDVIESPINMTATFSAVIADYPTQFTDLPVDKYDCFGTQVMRPIKMEDVADKNSDFISGANSGNNSDWFYPNPATSEINLNLPDDQSKISIYSVNGELLLSFQASSKNEKMDLSELSPGVYFIVLNGTDESIQIEKLVIK